MFNQHPAGHLFDGMTVRRKREAAAAVAMADKKKADAAGNPDPILDAVGDNEPGAPSDYASSDIALKAVAALQEWAEVSTGDLDEGESLATRLSGMMVGVADADKDGEISDEEWSVMEIGLEAAWDYLASKGVSDDDISALLNDWDDEAAARVQELLASRLPDGEEAAAEDMDSFVFGDGSDEATFDAVYKMKVAFRGGKKVRIKKRVAGTVRLSAKQKLAVRKMLRRSHSAGAQMRRAKSVRMRRKAGM